MNLSDTDVENARCGTSWGWNCGSALAFLAHAASEMRRGGRLLLRKRNKAMVELVMQRGASMGVVAPVQERPAETDPWFYRIVVATLGLAVVGSVAGIVLLSWLSQSGQVPDALAIGSGAIGRAGRRVHREVRVRRWALFPAPPVPTAKLLELHRRTGTLELTLPGVLHAESMRGWEVPDGPWFNPGQSRRRRQLRTRPRTADAAPPSGLHAARNRATCATALAPGGAGDGRCRMLSKRPI